MLDPLNAWWVGFSTRAHQLHQHSIIFNFILYVDGHYYNSSLIILLKSNLKEGSNQHAEAHIHT